MGIIRCRYGHVCCYGIWVTYIFLSHKVLTPFLVATAAGQDLQIVDIAVSYSDNDNCVVRSELEIDAETTLLLNLLAKKLLFHWVLLHTLVSWPK